MPQLATRCAVLFVFALWPLAACGADDGQGTADRPSVTASPSPTRTLPSRTRSPDVPDQTESEPRPSRSMTSSPDTTGPATPTASPTREPEPEPESQQPTARTSTVIAVPVPATTSSAPSFSSSPSPAGEAGATAEEDGVSSAVWVAVAFLAVAATIGTWLLVRARRRQNWHTSLRDAQAEVAWFARDLVPQLRTSGSVDQVVGGWHVAVPRVASAEDQLTALSSSAPSQEDAVRALQLRDAIRSAREKLETLSGPGRHDEWGLDLDEVEAALEAVLEPVDGPGAVPPS